MMHWLPQSKAWRVALVVSGVLTLCAGTLVGYWILTGKRMLELELAALRASGSPEFPEQIDFSPLPGGEDPTAWWAAIDEAGEARAALTIEGLPECASRLAAGESAATIDAEQLASLKGPRRIGALSDCELALLRQRVEGNRLTLELALQVEKFAPYDWQAAFQTPAGSFEQLLALPRISAYLSSIRVLCAQAVHCAVDGEFANASHCIELAGRATELLGQASNCITSMARAAGLGYWINEGVLPVLNLLPADADWSKIDARLAALDLPAEFQAACIGERAIGNGIYRVWRETGSFDETILPMDWAEAQLVRTFIDRDQATYLELLGKTIATSAERESVVPWRKLEREFEKAIEERYQVVDGTNWKMLMPKLPEAGRYWLGMQTRIRLVRAALFARHDGADPARAWLARWRDPFDGEALRTRLDVDGILAMWSVGEDGADDPVLAAREKHLPLDDILVEVRVR